MKLNEDKTINKGSLWFHGSGFNANNGVGSIKLNIPTFLHPLYLAKEPAFAIDHMSGGSGRPEQNVKNGTFFIFKLKDDVNAFDMHSRSDVRRLSLPAILSQKLVNWKAELWTALQSSDREFGLCLLMLFNGLDEKKIEAVNSAKEAEKQRRLKELVKPYWEYQPCRQYLEDLGVTEEQFFREPVKYHKVLEQRFDLLFSIDKQLKNIDDELESKYYVGSKGDLVYDYANVKNAKWDVEKIFQYYRRYCSSMNWEIDDDITLDGIIDWMGLKRRQPLDEGQCAELLEWIKALPQDILRQLTDAHPIDKLMCRMNNMYYIYLVAGVIYEKISKLGYDCVFTYDNGHETIVLFNIKPIQWISNNNKPLNYEEAEKFKNFIGAAGDNISDDQILKFLKTLD